MSGTRSQFLYPKANSICEGPPCKAPSCCRPSSMPNRRWYLVLDWEPGREHGSTTIRPVTDAELDLLNRYIGNLLTEAWDHSPYAGIRAGSGPSQIR